MSSELKTHDYLYLSRETALIIPHPLSGALPQIENIMVLRRYTAWRDTRAGRECVDGVAIRQWTPDGWEGVRVPADDYDGIATRHMWEWQHTTAWKAAAGER